MEYCGIWKSGENNMKILVHTNIYVFSYKKIDFIYSISVAKSILSFLHCFNCFFRIEVLRTICDISEIDNNAIKTFRQIAFLVNLIHFIFRKIYSQFVSKYYRRSG